MNASASALVALLLATGCSTAKEPALPLVRVRANKDLACPVEKLKIEALLGGRYHVTGCGRHAEYHSACDGLRCSVGREGEDPAVWRDRPDPGSLESLR